MLMGWSNCINYSYTHKYSMKVINVLLDHAIIQIQFYDHSQTLLEVGLIAAVRLKDNQE